MNNFNYSQELVSAAEQGDAAAQFALGSCYQFGYGIEKDYAKAAQWYEAAAKQGVPDAQFNLAKLYEVGFGVEMNKEKAIEWHTKAAEQGYALSKQSLRHLQGKGLFGLFKKK